MGIVDWSSPGLEKLLNATFQHDPSLAYAQLRESIKTKHKGVFHIRGPLRTFAADTQAAIFDRSSLVIVGKPMAAISLSPVLWSAKHARTHSGGQARSPQQQIRDAFVRQRFASRWNVRLIRCDAFAQRILLDFESDIAKPVERIALLPTVLHAIRDGSVRLCLLTDNEPFDNLRRYTFSGDWRIELAFRPSSPDAFRETFEVGELTSDVNTLWGEGIANAYMGWKNLSQKKLDQASRAGDTYEWSRHTVKTILNEAEEHCHRLGRDQDHIMEALVAISEAQSAIEADRLLPQYTEKKLASGYMWKNADVEQLRDFIREQFNLFEVESPLPTLRPRSASPVLDTDDDSLFLQLTFDDADGKARWGNRVLSISSGTEYFLLKRLHASAPQPVSYTDLRREITGKRVGITTRKATALKGPMSKIKAALRKCPGCTLGIRNVGRESYQLHTY